MNCIPKYVITFFKSRKGIYCIIMYNDYKLLHFGFVYNFYSCNINNISTMCLLIVFHLKKLIQCSNKVVKYFTINYVQ